MVRSASPPTGSRRKPRGSSKKLGVGLQTLREVEQFDYGVTEKQEVWRDGKTVLYRFIGQGRPTARAPLLICYALVNRP